MRIKTTNKKGSDKIEIVQTESLKNKFEQERSRAFQIHDLHLKI